MLEKTYRMGLLYDFYGPLLKEKQRQYVEMYYHDDLSLAEIAEHFDVSRQAVFDQIKRVEKLFEEWEKQLQLAYKYEKRREILKQMETLIDQLKELEE